MKISEHELILRKDRIIHEAFQLFSTHGIDSVRVKDIAVRAGVSEKSVYRYFNNKTELILATIAELWSEIVGSIIASMDADYEQRTGLEQIEILLKSTSVLFDTHSRYVVFSYDYKLFLIRHGTLLTEKSYSEELKPIQDLYIRALNKGMKDGTIGIHTDMEDVYYAVWGLIRGYIVKIVVYDNMYAGENMWKGRFELACSIILKGLKYKQ